MASLGSLVIELAANTARMQSDLGRAVNIAQSAATRMTTAFRTVTGALGLGGLGIGVQQVFGALVQNSSEAQASMVKLEQAIRRTGETAGVTVGQIEAVSSQIQSISRFTDESVKDAASSLLLFDKVVGETFERALRDSADLAAVMGTDVPEAAASLGKALQLPGEGLRVLVNAGIKFNDEQVKTLQYMTETGRAAEAQAIILGELEKRTNGAAAATKDTLGGALSNLKNQFGELLEAPGIIDSIVGAVNRLSDATTKVGPFVRAGFGQSMQVLKDLADEAWKLAKIVADPIGAIRGTGLHAPETPEQKRSQGHRQLAGPSGGSSLTDAVLAEETARRLASEARIAAAKKEASELEKISEQLAADVLRLNIQMSDDIEQSASDALKEMDDQRQYYNDLYEQYLESQEYEYKATSDEMTEYAQQAARNMQDALADFLFDPFQDGLKGMLNGFIDVIRRMVAEAAAAKIFGSKEKGGFGLGDFISSGVGSGLNSLFGFADGGSFQVGGSGGTDSQLVAFRASPDETVSISKPGQGSGASVVIHQHNDMRGSTPDMMKVLPEMFRRNNEALTANIIMGIRRGKYPV